jgi:hypothetical protein
MFIISMNCLHNIVMPVSDISGLGNWHQTYTTEVAHVMHPYLIFLGSQEYVDNIVRGITGTCRPSSI